jgi:hypothetical protein
MRIKAISVRTFSGAPVGLAKKPGLIAVDFLGIIPREDEAPAESWRRVPSAGAPASRRKRNVPQRRRRPRGEHVFSIPIIVGRAQNFLEILEVGASSNEDENGSYPGEFARTRVRTPNNAINHVGHQEVRLK